MPGRYPVRGGRLCILETLAVSEKIVNTYRKMGDKIMKKRISWILAAVLLLACLTGCGGNGKNNNQNGAAQPQDQPKTEVSAQSGTAAADYTLKFGHDHTTTSLFHVASLSFKEQVEKEPAGGFNWGSLPERAKGAARA